MVLVAYTSLLSLYNILGQIQRSYWHWLLPYMKAIKTLHKQVGNLQESLEMYSNSRRKNDQIDDLARQIAEFANEALLIIDSCVVQKIRIRYEDAQNYGEWDGFGEWSFRQAIEKVFIKIFWLKRELNMLNKDGELVPPQEHVRHHPLPAAAGPSTLPFYGNNDTMVGFDQELDMIMNELTGGQPDLDIIPITGMGGIGKTTLARNAFENKCVVEHFDIRVWFTISQKYDVHEILLRVLHDIGVDIENLESEKLAKLRELLHKQLYGKTYLIVMDDMWSTKAWDDFKSSFQDCENGSRIIVTTRLSDVAHYLGSRSPYFMNFLDKDKSWNLLCKIVFPHESCPPELEESGKEIAESCGGLPLAIVVIGGFLAKYDMKPIYWESIAINVNLYANSENDQQCLKILALSYQHLPIHLKPCFLYMRMFPEDHDIRVSELVNLWIADGCLKPLKDKNLEEAAEQYLRDLIDRNLISIRKQGRTGKIKSCSIHDLLRDLCMAEFYKENFFCVPKVQQIEPQRHEKACFLCCDENTEKIYKLTETFLHWESKFIVSHWVCYACNIMHPYLHRLKFVRTTLKSVKEQSVITPLPTTLRCLTIKELGSLCSISCVSMRLLWNLQTLNIINFHKNIVLPSEIWEMPQLRHIKINEGVLLDPTVDDETEDEDCTILKNLHTLSNIKDFTLREEVLVRIPNMKKLRIFYTCSNYFYNLALLSKLESLYLETGSICSKDIAFPHSLKKLELSCCGMDWKHMTIIGSLPNLEVLKLRSYAFEGPEWNPIEGEFLRLKFLLIGSTDLKLWGAEDIHFPCLETLVLRCVRKLEEIPSGIGDIGTLQTIELVGCSDHVIHSAERIIEEQQSMGNDGLKLLETYINR